MPDEDATQEGLPGPGEGKAGLPEQGEVKADPAGDWAAGEGLPIDGGVALLCDVELDATLQFGSREMLLREVLELGPGDVIELDRHVSDPVDLVVGDRIVARGEVVVVG